MSAPIYLYVGISIIIIIVLTILLTSCENKSCSPFIVDDYNVKQCMCSGSYPLKQINGTSRLSYNSGSTEYQQFANNQQANGGPSWKNTDFSTY